MSPVAPVPEPDATLVSVVMPVYNAQATMVRSIDSVLAQTHRQLELILVDDGSRDGSAAIMDAYAARDARVVAVRQPNGGVAAARNRGLQEARGTHVAFLDSDDWWEPEKLALQLAHMARTGARVCYTAYQRVAEDGRALAQVVPPERVDYAGMLYSNRIGNLTGIYARSLGEAAFQKTGHEDYVFWLDRVRRAGHAERVPETRPLAYYLVRGGSVSANKLRAAGWQWRIYRNVERLTLPRSAWCMLHYVAHALLKRNPFQGPSDVSSSSSMNFGDYAVVIPAYRAAGTLAHALDSVMAQTLPPRQVVVVDDGSPDGEDLARIVAGYRGKVVLVRQANAGPAAARNAGVRATSAAWVAFLDADDSWLPHKMRAQMALAADPRVGLVHGGAREDRTALPEEMDFDLLWRSNRICTSMSVVRREAFDALGGFFDGGELIGAEDYSLWLRIAHAGWKVRACPMLVGHYTPAQGSLTSGIERCAAAEMFNARMLGDMLALPPAMVRWKIRAIRTDFARHLIHARRLRPARRLLAPALCERPTLERIGLMSVSCLPVQVLDARRRLRMRGRRLVRNP